MGIPILVRRYLYIETASRMTLNMKILSIVLAFCEGNPLVIPGFPHKGPIMHNLGVIFAVCMDELWRKDELLVIRGIMTLIWCHSIKAVKDTHDISWSPIDFQRDSQKYPGLLDSYAPSIYILRIGCCPCPIRWGWHCNVAPLGPFY